MEVKFSIESVICLFSFHFVILIQLCSKLPLVLFWIAPSCTNLPHQDSSLYFVFSQNILMHHMKINVLIGN